MQRLSHFKHLFTAVGFLIIRIPSLKDAVGIWEQDAAVFGFGLLYNIEELGGYLRSGRHVLLGWAPEDQEHILTLFDQYLSFIIAICTAVLKEWEDTFIKSFAATIEDAYYEAIVQLTQSTKSCLQVV